MAETSRSNASVWVPPRDAPRWRRTEGLAMVDALRASGETPAAFAVRHGVQEKRVRMWIKRAEKSRAQAAKPALPVVFAPVRLVSPPSTDTVLDICVGNVVVKVRRGFDEKLLWQVVAALRDAGC